MTCARIHRYGDIVRSDGWEGCLVSRKVVSTSRIEFVLRSLIASGCVYDPGESYYEKSIFVILRTKLSSSWCV